jgi:squalene-associated FAD-dependent desaturase
MAGRVHIVGAGLAGLSAAVELSARGVEVAVHEGAGQAGGRCRSYRDPQLDMEIDNGNHLVLSGNHATRAFLARVGAEAELPVAEEAAFPFMDVASGERWTVRANDGVLPWWIFVPRRRVPGAALREYFGLARLLRSRKGARIDESYPCSGALHHRLIGPFLLAALNTDPAEGSAELAAAVVRETLAAGGRACRPMIARAGLSKAFVAPAIAFVEQRGGAVSFGRRLRGLSFEGDTVAALDFGETRVVPAAGDSVVLAVPPLAAAALVPGLRTPTEHRAIVNAHYKVDPPAGLPPMTGVVNGLAEWIFAFPGRLSVTISGADRLLDTPREELAERVWSDVARVAGLAIPMPGWQIVRETRATFAATPAQNALRPGARTPWRNLFLAGDWTDTGLPATIEGAIRSGAAAARLAAAN